VREVSVARPPNLEECGFLPAIQRQEGFQRLVIGLNCWLFARPLGEQRRELSFFGQERVKISLVQQEIFQGRLPRRTAANGARFPIAVKWQVQLANQRLPICEQLLTD
jgi:hypothetical protein